MDFFDVLRSRRSVRSYTVEPVSEQDLQELIESAVLAPTAMGAQPWSFSAVTDKGVLRQLDDLVKETIRSPEVQRMIPNEEVRNSLTDPGYSCFYEAPALVAILGEAGSPVSMIDCQLAAENLFLAAHAMGLGTCYMGFLSMARGNPTVRSLLRIPEGFELMAAATVGHPHIRPDGPPKRRPPRIEWIR